jgi:hypothetical protein
MKCRQLPQLRSVTLPPPFPPSAPSKLNALCAIARAPCARAHGGLSRLLNAVPCHHRQPAAHLSTIRTISAASSERTKCPYIPATFPVAGSLIMRTGAGFAQPARAGSAPFPCAVGSARSSSTLLLCRETGNEVRGTYYGSTFQPERRNMSPSTNERSPFPIDVDMQYDYVRSRSCGHSTITRSGVYFIVPVSAAGDSCCLPARAEYPNSQRRGCACD